MDTLGICCINVKFKYITHYIVHINENTQDSGGSSSQSLSTARIKVQMRKYVV